MVPSYRDYRRVLRAADARRPTGLLKSVFLLESPQAWCSLSLWDGSPQFSAHVPAHIEAARRVFGRLYVHQEHGPELWSTKWRLMSVTNNLCWRDFDLREHLVTMTALGGD
jgi:hypothetical protein